MRLPGLIFTSSMICVYIFSGPTQAGDDVSVVLPVTADGSRSMSVNAVSPETNQSKSWPVAKSTMFMTAPACWPWSTVAEYGAPAG